MAAQRETQRKLNDINSRQKEREVKATNDPNVIQKWRSDVDAATRANNDAVKKVNDAFSKLQDCLGKHREQPQKPRAGWLPM